MNDVDLMSLRADVDFTYDARGRMVRTNEPNGQTAPRLFVGRTHDGLIVRFGSTVPVELTQRIEALIACEPRTVDLQASPACLVDVRELLERHAPITRETSGPAYRFPASIAGAGEAIQLTDANLELARPHYPWLLSELAEWAPCFAIVNNEAAVSVCFSSRIGVRAAEAGLDTRSAYRGQGFAAAVTAAWGAAIRASGRTPIYSTGWENLASQGVARRVGLIRFGADMTWS